MSARFNFGMKEQPDYNPYGTSFTERQQRIIFGLPVSGLKLQEITIIMRKAEKLDMPELAEAVYDMYEEAITGRPPPTHL